MKYRNKQMLYLFISLFVTNTVLGLENIIPAEIKNDSFYDAIYKIAKTEPVKHILEIGSSSGEGSTEAFVKGIRENPSKPNLYCMEVSKARHQKLSDHYRQDKFVHCYNLSSISIKSFPQFSDIENFMSLHKTPLDQYGLKTVEGWYKQDINYIISNNLDVEGISEIKKINQINEFDVVLIDGSEFTGMAELEQVYGAKYILLDDTLTYKNLNNFQRLVNDKNYELIEKNNQTRNGYAIFKKRS